MTDGNRQKIKVYFVVCFFLIFFAAFGALLTARRHALTSRTGDDPVSVSTGTVVSGMTLTHMLQGVSLPGEESSRLQAAFRRIIDLRALPEGAFYEVTRSTSGQFHQLMVRRGVTEYVVQRSSAALFTAFKQTVPLSTVEHSTAGVINQFLWESMTAQGIRADLIMGFADVFAWEIDFNVEPRAGDRFALIWEDAKTPEGRVAQRTILAALYDGQQTGRHTMIYFEGDHYDAEGNSHHRAFLRAPLAFRRISSGFTHRRFHPVLRYFRPHLGIDYAAPTGTPVMSVGDGVVVHKGWKGAYGHYVEVRHNSVYTTCYGHLSRYAKGLSTGGRVGQGQVIGHVGSTGLATGPHLDFRVRKNGSYVNFLTLKIPSEKKIPNARRAEFLEQAARLIKRLDE